MIVSCRFLRKSFRIAGEVQASYVRLHENGATPTAVMSKENVSSKEDSQPDRRDFIKGASCAIGAAIGAVPMAAGVRVVLDPLTRQSASEGDAEFIRLTDVSDLPEGEPMKFAIVEDK